jgi:class 3 adenylate cyclase
MADPRPLGNRGLAVVAESAVGSGGLLQDSARQAHLREHLLAPANAILAYSEHLHDQARRLGRDLRHLNRILVSARQVIRRLAAADTVQGQDPATRRTLRHDLRSPLGAIIGFAELLAEDAEPAARPDLVRLIERAREFLDRVDRLTLAAGDDGAVELAAALCATADGLHPPAAASSGHILVIDDDENNRLLLEDILTMAGHQVVLAASGAEALRLLPDASVDLVLLDLLMPGMNGLEVLLAMRARPALAELPVLILSGIDHSDMTAQCLAAGAQDFIGKPFEPAILRARIGATLERKRLRDRERHYLDRLDAEKRRAEALLDNILPTAVIARLGRGERTIADRIEPVTVLFADIVGFTKIAARLPPARLVADLDCLVSAFDELATTLGVEKIKTVGDAYLAVAGVPEPRADHADAAAELALRMTETATALAPELGAEYRLRVGLHSGPVLAGVIGRRKFSYDVWGDTVNVASRLQQLSAPGEITISAATATSLAGRWRILPLGEVELRGRGGFHTHQLLRAD